MPLSDLSINGSALGVVITALSAVVAALTTVFGLYVKTNRRVSIAHANQITQLTAELARAHDYQTQAVGRLTDVLERTVMQNQGVMQTVTGVIERMIQTMSRLEEAVIASDRRNAVDHAQVSQVMVSLVNTVEHLRDATEHIGTIVAQR